MERLLDKVAATAGCFAALLALPPGTPFVAAMLVAIAVSALCEGVSERARMMLSCAYAALAVALPIFTADLPLIAYECMRDRRTWMRLLWTIPLIGAFPRIPPAAFCITTIMCAIASVLALRTATMARERNQYRVLRDSVREQALALERRNRDLMGDIESLRNVRGDAGSAGAGLVGAVAGAGALSPEAYSSLVFANLTERELEIAAHVAKGLDNREIASAVCASEGTVRNHISSILQKTGLRNRTQIAIAYLEQARP